MVFSNYNLGMFELFLLFSSHLKLENLKEKKKKNKVRSPLSSGCCLTRVTHEVRQVRG